MHIADADFASLVGAIVEVQIVRGLQTFAGSKIRWDRRSRASLSRAASRRRALPVLASESYRAGRLLTLTARRELGRDVFVPRVLHHRSGDHRKPIECLFGAVLGAATSGVPSPSRTYHSQSQLYPQDRCVSTRASALSPLAHASRCTDAQSSTAASSAWSTFSWLRFGEEAGHRRRQPHHTPRM